MRSRRASTVAAAAVAIIAAFVVSCGIPEDTAPRAISDDALPAELTDQPSATTTIPPELAEPAEIFLVVGEEDENSRLVSVPRQVRRDQSLEGKIRSVLESLVRRAGGESEVGTNYVPSTASILGLYLDRETGRLTVNLSSDMGQVDRRGLPLAYAQLVYTATQFEGVNSVAFRIDGQDGPVPNGDGESTQVVRRADYANFSPSPS